MGNAANVDVTAKSDVSKPMASPAQWPSAASAGGAAFANVSKKPVADLTESKEQQAKQ